MLQCWSFIQKDSLAEVLIWGSNFGSYNGNFKNIGAIFFRGIGFPITIKWKSDCVRGCMKKQKPQMFFYRSEADWKHSENILIYPLKVSIWVTQKSTLISLQIYLNTFMPFLSLLLLFSEVISMNQCQKCAFFSFSRNRCHLIKYQWTSFFK